jgi:hypothetical protein
MAVGKRLWGNFKESGETSAGNGVEFLRQWEEWVWRWAVLISVDRIPLLLILWRLYYLFRQMKLGCCSRGVVRR